MAVLAGSAQIWRMRCGVPSDVTQSTRRFRRCVWAQVRYQMVTSAGVAVVWRFTPVVVWCMSKSPVWTLIILSAVVVVFPAWKAAEAVALFDAHWLTKRRELLLALAFTVIFLTTILLVAFIAVQAATPSDRQEVLTGLITAPRSLIATICACFGFCYLAYLLIIPASIRAKRARGLRD